MCGLCVCSLDPLNGPTGTANRFRTGVGEDVDDDDDDKDDDDDDLTGRDECVR